MFYGFVCLFLAASSLAPGTRISFRWFSPSPSVVWQSVLWPGDWRILLLCSYIPAPFTESFWPVREENDLQSCRNRTRALPLLTSTFSILCGLCGQSGRPQLQACPPSSLATGRSTRSSTLRLCSGPVHRVLQLEHFFYIFNAKGQILVVHQLRQKTDAIYSAQNALENIFVKKWIQVLR